MAGFEHQSASTPAPSNSEVALRTLVLRLLAPRYPGFPGPEETQLLVGELPDELPAEVPLPDNAQIVGSLVRGQKSVEVVFDIDQPADRVLDFYREYLTAAGWRELEFLGPPGGFVSTAFPVTFCQDALDLSLSVTAYPMEEAPTDVRLHLHTASDDSPCRQPWSPAGWRIPMPRLVAPPRARQLGGPITISGAPGSSAMLETRLDGPALMAHYTAQLERAGWTRHDAGQDGPAVWSTWVLKDEAGQPWQGVFVVLEVPQMPDQRFVYLRVRPA